MIARYIARYAAITIAAGGMLVACSSSTTSEPTTSSTSSTSSDDTSSAPTVIVWHLSTIDVERVDVVPPARLTIVLDVEHVDRVQWCNDAGGTLVDVTCHDVDY